MAQPTGGIVADIEQLDGKPTELGEPSGSTRWRDRLLLAAVAVSAVLTLARWVAYARRGEIVPPYKLTLFWVDYRDGFVRRGLLGQIFSWVTSGQPSAAAATAFGLALSAVGALAFVWLIRELARDGGLPVVTLLAVSPLALPLVLRDLGRYDAVTVAVLISCTALLARHGRATLTVVAVLLAVATAVEEFAVMLAAPVVVLGVTRAIGDGKRRLVAATSVAVLTPAVLVAAVSVLVHPPVAALSARAEQAHRAGVGLPSLTGDDAASMLAATSAQQAATFSRYAPSVLLATAAGAAGLAVVSAYVLWLLVSRGSSKQVLWSGAWLFACAAALSLLGVDFLRWWSLALLAFASALVVLPRITVHRRATVSTPLLIAVVLLSLLAADFPIEPVRLTG